MTIFCSHCHRPLQAETSCLPRRARQAPSASKPFRSTKGASKARRDQINAELQALRSLLPISSQEKERLSYLNTMALVCLWLRRAHLFPPDSAPPVAPAFGMELLSLLPGFFLVLLANGKLAYISENVAQVLGLSTVELLAQGDTVFDILDGPVQEAVQEKLLLAQEQPGTEVTFVSKMRTSKAFRLQHGGNRAVAVRGRFVALHRPASPCASAFMAFCTPVAQLPADGDAVSQDDLFRSVHALDMTFTDVTESVIYHLGYHREELIGRSWYSLLHPDDTSLAAAQHRAVALGAGAAAAVLRVLRSDRTWAWLHAAARRDRRTRSIACASRSLSEQEAAHLRARQPAPPPPPPPPPARPATTAPPPPRALGLLAAQLRALADSLAPPPPPAAPAWSPAWPDPAVAPPGPPDGHPLARLLGDAGPPATHAHAALYPLQ
ncbi:neuronal PAS domain-containing protein 4 [Struthio camelus]|uniref:neuronal PAS domain-containing protein 4 n=1 Tax=Struthio camelus TaxID=8801 RepID=UPI003603BF51